MLVNVVTVLPGGIVTSPVSAGSAAGGTLTIDCTVLPDGFVTSPVNAGSAFPETFTTVVTVLPAGFVTSPVVAGISAGGSVVALKIGSAGTDVGLPYQVSAGTGVFAGVGLGVPPTTTCVSTYAFVAASFAVVGVGRP